MARSGILLAFSIFSIVSVTAHADLRITSWSPEGGPSSGGTTVLITGTGFFGGCATGPCAPVTVKFGTVAAMSVQIQSDTRLVVLTPEQVGAGLIYARPQPMTASVTVGTASTGFWFWYNDAITTPDLANFQRILVPSYNWAIPGALGSMWFADLTVFNAAANSATIYPLFYNTKGEMEGAAVLPGKRFSALILLDQNTVTDRITAPRSVRLLYVDPAHADDLKFNLRVYDFSRIKKTWGTEVPLVRERDLRTTAIELFPVPLDPMFRLSLRIYDPFRLGNAQVEIRYYVTRTGQLVATKTATLSVFERRFNSGVDVSFPGVAEFGNLLVDVPELSSVDPTEQLRIEIIPLTPGLRFWAMVSLTNNDTQQVTLLTPQ